MILYDRLNKFAYPRRDWFPETNNHKIDKFIIRLIIKPVFVIMSLSAAPESIKFTKEELKNSAFLSLTLDGPTTEEALIHDLFVFLGNGDRGVGMTKFQQVDKDLEKIKGGDYTKLSYLGRINFVKKMAVDIEKERRNPTRVETMDYSSLYPSMKKKYPRIGKC